MVVEGRLDLTGQRVVVRRGLVRSLDDRDRTGALDRRPERLRRERPEACHCDTADRPSQAAKVIDDRSRGIGDRAHGHDDLGRIRRAIWFDAAIAPTGQVAPFRERRVELTREPLIERSLAEPTLHVAVLVLDDAGHERLQRVEPGSDPHSRIPDEVTKELILR
jgi:hypothetical protein